MTTNLPQSEASDRLQIVVEVRYESYNKTKLTEYMFWAWPNANDTQNTAYSLENTIGYEDSWPTVMYSIAAIAPICHVKKGGIAS